MSLLFSTESTVFHYALSCPVVLCCAISLYSFLFQLMLKIILMDLWSLYALNRSQAIEHNMPAKNATTANEPEYGWRMHGLCSNVHPHEFECMFITFVYFCCVHLHACNASIFNASSGTILPYSKIQCVYIYIGVSKNRGTPKWMVYNGKPY